MTLRIRAATRWIIGPEEARQAMRDRIARLESELAA
jgi:hypothetical protein